MFIAFLSYMAYFVAGCFVGWWALRAKLWDEKRTAKWERIAAQTISFNPPPTLDFKPSPIVEPGQRWRRRSGSPWPDERVYIVLEVKDGWVKHRLERGSSVFTTPIGRFRDWHTLEGGVN